MDFLRQLFETFEFLRDAEQLARLGYVGLTVIIFMETGLLIGFFLPGDSLLVTAGLLISIGAVDMNLIMLNLLLIPAAIFGDAVGYYIGRRAGRSLFQRPDSRLFKRKHLLQTQAFYERHGGKTIVMARFVPIVRTFAPVIAGVANMPYRDFVTYNVAGGIGWIVSMTFIGYFLGQVIPGVADHIEILALVIIAISLLPILIEYIRHRRAGDTVVDAAVESAAGLEADAMHK